MRFCRDPLPYRVFLMAMATAGLATFTALWAWVAFAPLAFLDPEYPAWLAKRTMLANCDLGEVLIVGDSRAAVDILPVLLPFKATNLAVGGGESIEAYTEVARAFACDVPPQRVLISLGAGHFMRPDLFWERSVKFGLMSADDLALLRRESERLHDWSVYDEIHGTGPRGRLRAALYTVHFPSLYFPALAKGGVLLRWWENHRAFGAAMASRGQYFFGTAEGSTEIAAEADLGSFRPLPILDAYFNHMLKFLAARGVAVDLLPMPLNEATWHATNPQLQEEFAAYLRSYAAQYRNVRLGEPMPHWPDRLFGDQFAHLNPSGAALLTSRLGACLADNQRACQLGWTDPEPRQVRSSLQKRAQAAE